MLKKSLILTNIIIISLVVIIIAFLIAEPDDNYKNDESFLSSYSDSSMSTESNPIYIMKNSNGIIGIYKYGEDVPIRIINVSISGLPELDQNLLNNGIKVYSDEELSRLIEDYNS